MARPREFDDTEVLDAALQCFWRRGLEATSIRDLAQAMGISTPSIHNAFGGKQELYVEALEHYCRTRTHPMLKGVERRHTGVAALVAFFRRVLERASNDPQRRGCFLMNSALGVVPHDRLTERVVGAHLGAIQGFLHRPLLTAVASGEVKPATDAGGTADHLMSVLLGARVLARSRPERELLQRIFVSALAASGIPARRLAPLRSPRTVRPSGRKN